MLDEQQLDDLLAEWEQCRQSGHESSAEELCQGSPELLVELKHRITRLKSTDWLFEEDADDDPDDSFVTELMNKAVVQDLALGSMPYDTCVRSLTEAGLISVEDIQRLESVISDSSFKADGSNLLRHLVAKGMLTRYQATTVADGKAKNLVLGNYVLLEKIGVGGMGQVFLARHRRMNRQVALKVLPERTVSSPVAVERFRREVEVAAKLVHPNIVTAYDADEANGTHFLVMEFVAGQDLAFFVKRSGPLPLQQAVDFLLQAAAGLEYAHRQGVVHRDIKPSNLLLDANGIVKILDLGLARIVMGTDSGNAPTQAELTQDGAVLGTVDYMAPEQAENTKVANVQADIYALGCTLFYLLTGQAVYRGETLMQKMLAHRESPIPSLRSMCPEVPEQVESIFKKMVSKKPEDRQHSMASVIADFQSCDSCWRNASTTSVVPARVRPAYAVDTVSEDGRQVTQEHLPGKVAKPPRRAIYFAGAVVLLGLAGYFVIFSDIIISLKSKDGTLTVHVNQANAIVRVLNDQGAVEITDQSGVKILTLSVDPGRHRLKIEKDGFQFFTEDFTMESGGAASVEATLLPLDALSPTGQASRPITTILNPGFQHWMKNVASMTADHQIQAVAKKLQELNPDFDGKVTSQIEKDVVSELSFLTQNVTDLSPVRALPQLDSLVCWGGDPFDKHMAGKGRLSDLSPLKGMRLKRLNISNSLVSDLSALEGMNLATLSAVRTRVSSLTPLKGMPLHQLYLTHSPISDLSPLRGMPLAVLQVGGTDVSDLSPLSGLRIEMLSCWSSNISDLTPLKGMPLRILDCSANSHLHDLSPLAGIRLSELYCFASPISDLTPLSEMQLTVICFTPGSVTEGLDAIRQMKSLKQIALGYGKQFSPDDFWRRYDEGQFTKQPTP